ncbi:MAG: class I SAM-dependent methyltransferase [Pseudomonadota bacterium]
MTPAETNIYGDSSFRDVDVGQVMRIGHVDIADGDRYIIDVVVRHRAEIGKPLRIIDIGSGSGHLTKLLAEALPDCEVIANEIESAPIAQAKAKLLPHPNARVFERPFDEWNEPTDVVISWGSHHHMSHGYLSRLKNILTEDGVFIVGDEFCPEYIPQDVRDRLDRADTIVLAGGYIFDSESDLRAYRDNGSIPEWSLDLEISRRKALWHWYKFVCDKAIENNEWMVAVCELQIARDDLMTEFASEHKTSSYLLQRELSLSGYRIVESRLIGDRDPSLMSFEVFCCRPIG